MPRSTLSYAPSTPYCPTPSSLRLRLEAQAGDRERFDRARDRLGEAPLQVEPLRAGVERGADRRGRRREDRRELRRRVGVIGDQLGDRVERAEIDGRREDRATPVTDDAALRFDHELAADLIGRAPEQRRAPDRLPVADA
jgi:hypothetical protein